MTASTRHAIVLVGGLVAALIVLALAVPAVARILETTKQSSHELPADLASLTVDGEVGDVTIRAAGPGEQPGASAEIRSGLTDPGVQTAVDGDTAVLSDSCPTSWWESWWDSCSVDWEVVVPADSAVLVEHSVGDLTVREITGPVALSSDVGSISATGLGGHTVRAESSVGEVTIELTAPPEDLQVTSSTGDVSITVPDDGTSYRVLTDTSLGETTNTIGSDPTGTRVIDVRTSVGDITLRRAG